MLSRSAPRVYWPERSRLKPGTEPEAPKTKFFRSFSFQSPFGESLGLFLTHNCVRVPGNRPRLNNSLIGRPLSSLARQAEELGIQSFKDFRTRLPNSGTWRFHLHERKPLYKTKDNYFTAIMHILKTPFGPAPRLHKPASPRIIVAVDETFNNERRTPLGYPKRGQNSPPVT